MRRVYTNTTKDFDGVYEHITKNLERVINICSYNIFIMYS